MCWWPGDFISDIALTPTAEIYHTATGQWTSTGGLPEGRFGHTATLLPDDTVLVAGGTKLAFGFTTVLASAEIFHPDTGMWSATGSLAEARTLHTTTVLANGQTLAVGGYGSNDVSLGSAELYNPASGSWMPTTAALQTPRHGHSAVQLLNGNVLVAGGADSTGSGTVTVPTRAEKYIPGR